MFGHNYKAKVSQMKPLHDGTTVGRSWSVENNGTGTPEQKVNHGSGGVPFHAAFKFQFNIGNAGTTNPSADPIAKRHKV